MIAHVGATSPLQRNVTIEDVGNAAAFLCSDLAAGITGQVLYVDAGFNIVGMSFPDAAEPAKPGSLRVRPDRRKSIRGSRRLLSPTARASAGQLDVAQKIGGFRMSSGMRTVAVSRTLPA